MKLIKLKRFVFSLFIIMSILILFPNNLCCAAADETVLINDGWMYREGNSPINSDGLPIWTQDGDSIDGWNELKSLNEMDNTFKNDQPVWFKIKLSMENRDASCIYFKKLLGQALEVYIDSDKIFESKRFIWSFTNNVNTEIVTLTPGYSGKTLFVKAVPGAILKDVGPRPDVIFGNTKDLIPIYFKGNFNSIILRLIIGSISIFLGLALIIVSFFLIKLQRKSWISIGVVAITSGVLISLSSSELYLFLGNYEQLALILYDIVKIIFLNSLTYMLLQILGVKHKLPVLKRMFQVLNVYSILCLIMLSIHCSSGYQIFTLYRLFTYDILGILYIIALIIIAFTVIYHATKKDIEAKLILMGFLYFIILMVVDFFIFFAISRRYQAVLWYWGILIVILSFLIILGKRIQNNHLQLIKYSKELEIKNEQLDSMWKEIKESRDQLAELNMTLEYRVNERTNQLEESNSKLSLINMELSASNEELSNTLEILKVTQGQLVKNEKMAVLGQLVSGVAHEINTPLGAIQASIANISEKLKIFYREIPSFLRDFSEERIIAFINILNKSIEHTNYTSTKQERMYRDSIENQLLENGINEPHMLSGMLAVMGLYDVKPFVTFLKGNDSFSVIRMAYLLSGLKRSAETIEIAVEKTSKVVFALKAYAHFDSQGEMKTVDIRDGLDTVLTLYQNKIKQGVEVIRNYGEIPMILCYPDELNQVWTNIIHNSLQAMEYKGVLIVNVYEKDCNIVVEITDNGPGIPDEIKERIFEPFFTTKPQGEGSGLGLDIVRKIISKHDGKIMVNSRPGETRFSVAIPSRLKNDINIV